MYFNAHPMQRKQGGRMEEHVRQALEIVKAQASCRTMTEEEISSMVKGLSAAIQRMLVSGWEDVSSSEQAGADRTPKDTFIICLECRKSFKMLTRKHLLSHGLSPNEYREKWGYAKNAPLVCRALQRHRRKKMKDMKLWEKRRKKAD